MRIPVSRLFLIAALTGASACHKADAGAPDAGHDAPAAKAVRNAAAGEKLVDLEKSKLTLTIIKDRDLTSPVRANVLLRDGALSFVGSGAARISVDLTTFDSSIPMRNERVKNFFFETSATGWDTAELTIPSLPEAAVTALRDHKSVAKAAVEGDLKLHGKTSRVKMTLDAGWNPSGELWVRSSAPVEVKISDFGLVDNLKRLSSICMHDSIDDLVKIDVALEFPP
jgi:polyisoprenoid-binding protein YceI